jgi:hypothetical protein
LTEAEIGKESLEHIDPSLHFEHIEQRFGSLSDHRPLASDFGSYCISEYDPKEAFQRFRTIKKELEDI